MKKTAFTFLFIILISLTCIFYSCNSSTVNKDTETAIDNAISASDYEEAIKALEDQIIEIMQNHYISEAERNKEIDRLESMISELKQSSSPNKNDSESTQTETKPPENSSDTSTDHAEEIFHYTVKDEIATITGYSGISTQVAIPAAIDGYKVIAIADDAFDNEHVTDIIISDGITHIGWFAFSKCQNLQRITLPNSVESIGYSAFPADVVRFSLIVPEGSFAEEYAVSYGITYTLI